AKAEGISVGSVTAAWLAKHPEYGGSEGKALSTDLGIALWNELTKASSGPSSNWLLLERGYDYDIDRPIARGAMGESALHPMVIGAYGEGDAPTLGKFFQIYQTESKH